MNSCNETFYPLDYWYHLYGFPYIVDIIVAYIITPIWFLSLILCIFSLVILLKPPFFASNFFRYMRFYVANCLIISAISLTIILTITRRIFSIANTYEASFYSIYVFLTAENVLFLFSSCIEISLVVERVSYLLPRRFKLARFTSFNGFFLIIFIICILINIPGIFLFEPSFADVQLDSNTPFRIWYFNVAPLSYSL